MTSSNVVDVIRHCEPYISLWKSKYEPLAGNSSKYELEFRFYDIPMYLEMASLGGKLHAQNIVFETRIYAEYAVSIKGVLPDGAPIDLKCRTRESIKDLSALEVASMDLCKTTSGWEAKTKLEEIKLHSNLALCLDKEIRINRPNIEKYKSHPQVKVTESVKFVQGIAFTVYNWKIEFRLKYDLKIGAQVTCNRILSSQYRPSMSCEIEFNGKLHEIQESHLEKLYTDVLDLFLQNKASRMLFADKSNSYMKTIFPKSRTIARTHLELLDSEEFSNYRVSPKIDGYFAAFHNTDYKCTIMSPECSYIVVYNTSIKDTFMGHAEKISHKGQTILFPFLVQFTLDSITSHVAGGAQHGRFTNLEKLEKILSKQAPAELVFNMKPILTWTSKEERCQRIVEALMYDKFPIDGVVLQDPAGLMDYKFKNQDIGHNTVDMLVVTNINNSSYIGRQGITFNLYFPGSNPKVDRLPDTNLPEIFKYQANRGYFISAVDGTIYLHYHKLIMECHPLTHEPMKPRFDKTNKFILKGYLGNDKSVIDDHVIIEEGAITIAQLRELSNRFDISEMKVNAKDLRTQKLLVNDFIVDRYFSADLGPSVQGIIGNWIKSNIIFFIHPFIQGLYKGRFERLLMIDGGHGADIDKYIQMGNIKHLVLTDPSKKCIEDASKRVKQINEGENKSQISSVRLEQSSIIYDDYLLKSTHGSATYDVIDWQMAIHYSWSIKTKAIIMRKLSKLTHSGSIIIITAIDGVRLRSLISASSSHKVFKIDNNREVSYRYLDDEKYIFRMTNRMDDDREEFYIDPPDLFETFKEHGYECTVHGTFENFIKRHRWMFDTDVWKLEPEKSPMYFFKRTKDAIDHLDRHPDAMESSGLWNYYMFRRQ